MQGHRRMLYLHVYECICRERKRAVFQILYMTKNVGHVTKREGTVIWRLSTSSYHCGTLVSAPAKISATISQAI